MLLEKQIIKYETAEEIYDEINDVCSSYKVPMQNITNRLIEKAIINDNMEIMRRLCQVHNANLEGNND